MMAEMKGGLENKIIRVLGVILGLLFIIFPLAMFVLTGETDMWIQPIIGFVFFVYGLGGYKDLSKILPRYKNMIKMANSPYNKFVHAKSAICE